MDNIKVSKGGYDKLQRDLEVLEKELTEIGKYKNKIAVENGDVWHDNNDFEQAEIQERAKMREIHDLKLKIANAEIIEDSNSSNKVRFGSVVELIIYGDDFTEEETLLFSDSDECSIYKKISVNSPIGKVIFGKEVGSEEEYEVNGNKMKVKVVKILN